MALYSYQAFKRDGTPVGGSIDAASSQEARERLVRMGLMPTVINRAAVQSRSWWSRLTSWIAQSQVGVAEVVFFTQQLAVLLKAGIPLMHSLELLIEQSEKSLQRVVIELKDGVKEGKSLAEGLEKFPSIFDTTYVQLVRAGEASGRLEVILDRLSLLLERSEELRKRVRKAFNKPLMNLAIIGVVLVVILKFVIPQLSELFISQGAILPLSTRILLAASALFNSYFIVFSGTVALLAALFWWWKSTASGKQLWDAFTLRLPLVGYFIRMSAVVQFCNTLGMLVEAGVNLSEALHIVSTIIDNSILVSALTQAREKIIKQGKITLYLKATGLFPPVALYLIRTGEESGQLAQMLLTVAETYDREVRERADRLTDSLDPLMTLVMGVIVGFIIFSIGKPIMQLSDVAAAGIKQLQ